MKIYNIIYISLRTLQEVLEEVQQVRREHGLVEDAVPGIVRVREPGADRAVHEASETFSHTVIARDKNHYLLASPYHQLHD